MDYKIRELYGIENLEPEKQKAVELYFNEAVECFKLKRNLSFVQNLDLFIRGIGANKLPENDLQDLVDKTKLVVETVANNQFGKIHKDWFNWDKGLYSANPPVNENKVDKGSFQWESKQTVPYYGKKEGIKKGKYNWRKPELC
jgi:hypothetical protein